MIDQFTTTEENKAFLSQTKPYFVVNPVAGHGISADAAILHDQEISVYESTAVGDCRRYVAEVCRKDPNAWIVVCGGDGTISEGVSGILDAGAGKTAVLSAIPTGSGNDFVRYVHTAIGENTIVPMDAIRVGDRYSANMINIGFDCSVVSEAQKIKNKAFVSGSMAYILGVIRVLIRKKTFHSAIHVYGVNGEECDDTVDGEFLLTAVANGPFCGGGFMAATPARPDDGLLDLVMIRNVTRSRFVKLVGDYRAGTHFDAEGNLADKFVGIIEHRRCRSFALGGIGEICVDGEVIPASAASGEVLPGAFRYVRPKAEWIETVCKG